MVLDKIITLANSKVKLRFLALERSLRAVGCDLPLMVIPYDNNKFELPANSFWWELPEITHWLQQHNAHRMMRKYQCLTQRNYQYVDSDVVFLTNPVKALEKISGFVSSCGHWHNPGHTYTAESLSYFKSKSSTWQKSIFNAGQFACDTALYTSESLQRVAESPQFKYSCLLLPYHDQPGLNLLVNSSDIVVNNITLPPYNMESTWAGDYEGEDYERLWKGDKKPYIIHWAGCRMDTGRPIDELYYQFLTREEKKEWNEQVKELVARQRASRNYLRILARKFKKSIKAFND